MYLTDKQLAERFNVSRQWVWMQAKRDATFPQPIKLTQGCTRFSLSEIEKYENQCKEMSDGLSPWLVLDSSVAREMRHYGAGS